MVTGAGRHHHQRTLAQARPAPLHPTPGNYAPVLARPDAPHNACQPRLQPVMLPFLRLRVATAPAGLEIPPISGQNDADADGAPHRGAVASRRAPPHGTAPPLSVPASLSHPKREPGFQGCSGHTRGGSAVASPHPRSHGGDLRHLSSARVTRAPQLTSMASPRRESIPVWVWPSTC